MLCTRELHFFAFILLCNSIGCQADQCQVEEGTPSVWLGDDDGDADTYCKARPEYCHHFGLDYVCSDPSGGSHDPCVNGTRVLCCSPPSQPLAHPTPAWELRVVAYNVWELRYLYSQNGQRERTCRTLGEVFQLRQDIDVIVFNEVFMGGCFSNFNSSIDTSTLTIRDILTQYGFTYYTQNVGEDRELPKFENGGVFIASRWEIVDEAETVFTESVPLTADALSAKGAKYARVMKVVDGITRYYNIFGTHLQATKGDVADLVRVSQAEETRALVKDISVSHQEPVIYAGDLNTDFYDRAPGTNTDDILSALNAAVPPIIGELNYTTDGLLNDVRDGDSAKFKDYAIYDREYLHPTSATQEILRPRAAAFVEICMEALSARPVYPNSDNCRKRQNITDLSDHFAVIGVFHFDDNDQTSDQASESMTTYMMTTSRAATISPFTALFVTSFTLLLSYVYLF